MNRLLNNLRWVCHHLHIDKSKTINASLLNYSLAHMKEKWFLMREVKKNYTKDDLNIRMSHTINNLVNQGCKKNENFYRRR